MGTWLDDGSLRAVRTALDEMVRAATPFHPDRQLPRGTWVEPSLVAVVGFRNWTAAGRLRFPVFKGFSDEGPDAITWDAEGPR